MVFVVVIPNEPVIGRERDAHVGPDAHLMQGRASNVHLTLPVHCAPSLVMDPIGLSLMLLIRWYAVVLALVVMACCLHRVLLLALVGSWVVKVFRWSAATDGVDSMHLGSHDLRVHLLDRAAQL
jgi:hypothetical protein